MVKKLGCISGFIGLAVTGVVFMVLSMVCFGIMVGIGNTVVPSQYRDAYRRWLSGIPPDDPAFEQGIDDTFSGPEVAPDCWETGGWPLAGISNGPITQPYSPDHGGVDIGVPVGTMVSAPADGTVVWAGWEDSGYGNLVIVASGNVRFYLAHLAEPNVRVGQTVRAGDIVGLSGNTGRSTGPHLHYEVRVNGNTVNPHSVTVGETVRCMEQERFTAGGATGGGANGTEVAARWYLPTTHKGWLLQAPLDTDRAGIAPGEAVIRVSDEGLFVWPAGYPELAMQGGIAVRDHDDVAVGPTPGTVWAHVAIRPEHEYLIAVWQDEH